MTVRYWPLVAAPAVAALGTLLLRRQLTVVTVNGNSMLPALCDGDKVLVRRVSIGQVRTGDVVVVEQPADGSGWAQRSSGRVRRRQWMIKRAAALPRDPVPDAFRASWPAGPDDLVPDGKLVVLGDNPERSYDSRVIGYIPADRLLGVVLRKMARSDRPAQLAG